MDREYEKRKESWIARSLEAGGENTYSELIRISRGIEVKREPLEVRLKRMDDREDCADFNAAGFIRILHQFPDSPHIPEDLKTRIKKTVLDFKYWPDETGIDGMCTWSENHTILFASTAYLAGLKYPEETFTNSGLTGREMSERFLPRIRMWLDLRFATGFSEWLSNVYYNEDLPALFNLVDFAAHEEIRKKAAMIIDLLLTDIALNSYDCIFASSHGRSYEWSKKDGLNENTGPIARLLFGGESFIDGNYGAVSLILSSYTMPPIIAEMARNHRTEADENRQICGYDINKADRLGLDRSNKEHGMMFLAGEAYMHPRFISHFVTLLDDYNWWENFFFQPIKPFRKLLKFMKAIGFLPVFAKMLEKDISRGYRGEAHVYTYRTPDYMMSSTQNYRVGYGGDQQSPWQVTLGDNATCFITHPGKAKTLVENDTPNYWSGYGTQPGVAQYKNCALMVYKINTTPGLYITNKEIYTHAWFPEKEFDAVVQAGHWIFASKGDAYVGLWSKVPTQWGDEGDGRCDLIAHGKENIWICQTGSRSESGSFERFMEDLVHSKPVVKGLKVSFDSPGNGNLQYGWKRPLRLNGEKLEIHGSHRYKNKFCEAQYPAEKIEFSSGKSYLKLDYMKGIREFDGKESIIEN